MMDSQKEVEHLRKENERLKKEVERLRKIEKEYREFKAKHNQTVSELRKALKIKEDKETSEKSIGAQKGHKAYSRHVPERIDVIKTLNLKRCPNCGEQLP